MVASTRDKAALLVLFEETLTAKTEAEQLFGAQSYEAAASKFREALGYLRKLKTTGDRDALELTLRLDLGLTCLFAGQAAQAADESTAAVACEAKQRARTRYELARLLLVVVV